MLAEYTRHYGRRQSEGRNGRTPEGDAKAIAASDPKAYEAMANGMLIVSTNPEELIALETSGIPEYGPEFFQRDGGGGFRWIEIAGTRFYVTYHPAQFYKYQEQKALWEFEKLFPGIFG